jgi:hypothetical protein
MSIENKIKLGCIKQDDLRNQIIKCVGNQDEELHFLKFNRPCVFFFNNVKAYTLSNLYICMFCKTECVKIEDRTQSAENNIINTILYDNTSKTYI